MADLISQYAALSPERKQYFSSLASGNDSAPIDYFERVPESIRDHPELVDKFLDGDPALGIPDRDWSHITSQSNGGSDEAYNGFFEDASINRARGANNATGQEIADAQLASKEDATTLSESLYIKPDGTGDELPEFDPEEADILPTIFQDVDDVATSTAAAGVVEFAGAAFEFSLEALAPMVGGTVAAKAVYDRFEEPKDKWGWGALAGGATVLALASPPGQVLTVGYIGYRAVQRLRRVGQRKLKST